MKLVGLIFVSVGLYFVSSTNLPSTMYSSGVDSNLAKLLQHLRNTNIERIARGLPDTSSNNNPPYSSEMYGLRHFKNRTPLLSFRSRKSDPFLFNSHYDPPAYQGDIETVEKRKAKNPDEYNRWLMYSNYLLNPNQKRADDDSYRQYFRNQLWENL